MNNAINVITKHWAGVLLIVLSSALVALTLSMLQTPQYLSSSRMLILQKNDGDIDAYTLARASEKLGNNLATIIGTSAFMDRAISTGLVNTKDFSSVESQRRAQWLSFVSADLVPETSILEINVRHPDRAKAEKMLVAIESVLLTESAGFLGMPQDQIFMQVVDAPLTSLNPVAPVVPLDTLAGALLGVIVSFGYAGMRELQFRRKKIGQMPIVSRVQEHTYPDRSRSSAQDFQPFPHRIELTPHTTPAASSLENEQLALVDHQAPSDLLKETIAIGPHHDKVHSMYDDLHAPFGNQYYFENRVIQLSEEVI